MTTCACDRDVTFYNSAKTELTNASFVAEIAWQGHRTFESFTESDLLRESAWVILCSGFKESIVRSNFAFISLCFCDWQCAEVICDCSQLCRATAMTVFKNSKKIDAIIEIATLVKRQGFAQFKRKTIQDPLRSVQELPFIGPITAFHLLKNLGFPTAKPDRHLQRMANAMGYNDAHQLCGALAMATGDPVHVVDIVLWRYAEQHARDHLRTALQNGAGGWPR
jgi:hypothetical protein